MRDYNATQAGAVLVFKESVTPERAQELVRELSAVLEYVPNVQTFDPSWGGPVWYIP